MAVDNLNNERELLRRIAQDDELAYKLLFERYYAPLYAAIIQYTHKKDDAEDIIQSVFLKVWERRHELTEINNPEDWLFITARNEFIGRFRKMRSEDRYRQYLTQIFEEGTNFDNNFLLLQQRDNLIRRAISLLPEKQQEAFYLSRYKCLTYEEIADKMQISRTTVKEHISRAVRFVKSFLQEHKDQLLTGSLFFYYFFDFLVLLFGTGCVFIL